MTKKGITPAIARKIRAEKGLRETKLQKMRQKKGWSQADLAEISGIPIRRIQKYEQGDVNIEGAKLFTLCSLCKALGCKIEDILESEELITMLKATK